MINLTEVTNQLIFTFLKFFFNDFKSLKAKKNDRPQ